MFSNRIAAGSLPFRITPSRCLLRGKKKKRFILGKNRKERILILWIRFFNTIYLEFYGEE